MRQSALFTKTRRDAPKDEVAKNAQLLIRAGYIHKEMAGVYDFLPLGFRVIERVKAIVREEMEGLGAQELLMSTLQRKELWERTNRWSDKEVEVWFKSTLAAGGEVGFGWSHEEPITEMMTQYLASYRDLPAYVFQFQNKLRNELRAKSGIMRGREFLMKDMYSYTSDAATHKVFYDAAIAAYLRVFARVGLGEDTYLTVASGGAFTEFSHEFQTLSEVGEDTIYVHRAKKIAVNKEVLTDAVLQKLGIARDELEEVPAIEVGNIFDFGGIKSEQLGLRYRTDDGKDVPVYLGSYGIGITRLAGAVVEHFADEKGLVWPESVAPFLAHLVCLVPNDPQVAAYADALYKELVEKGVDVLYDDRDARAGEKLNDADLIGIPARIVIGKKTLESGKIESTYRLTGQTNEVSREQLIEFLVGAQRQHRSHA